MVLAEFYVDTAQASRGRSTKLPPSERERERERETEGRNVNVVSQTQIRSNPKIIIQYVFLSLIINEGGSVAEWLACWTQAQKGLGSNRSRDAVG